MNRNRVALAAGVALALSLLPITAFAQEGMGSVLVGTSGTADDLVLSDAEATAAAEALAGKTVGIVATTLETEYHKLLNETARDLLESWGATVEICDSQVDTTKALDLLRGLRPEGRRGHHHDQLRGDRRRGGRAGHQGRHHRGAGHGPGPRRDWRRRHQRQQQTIGTRGQGRRQAPGPPRCGRTSRVKALILDYPDIPDLVARADAIDAGPRRDQPQRQGRRPASSVACPRTA